MAEWARHGLSFLRTGLGWKPRDERLRPDGKIDDRWFPDWADVILGLDAPTVDKKVIKRAYKKRAMKLFADVSLKKSPVKNIYSNYYFLMFFYF